MQKYGDPTVRQKAIAQLGEIKAPEAIAVLLSRFTVLVDPLTTDSDEKDEVFRLIKARGQDAVKPVQHFLIRSESASSWALKLLLALLPEAEVIGIACSLLLDLGKSYSRDPEKKSVLIHYLEGKDDPRIAASLVPLLEDMSDDIRIATLRALTPLPSDEIDQPLLKILGSEDTARRVQTAAVAAASARALNVQEIRKTLESRMPEGYSVDRAGVLRKRT